MVRILALFAWYKKWHTATTLKPVLRGEREGMESAKARLNNGNVRCLSGCCAKQAQAAAKAENDLA